MSVHQSSAAWRTPLDDPTTKLLLLALADMADDDGVCWPRQATLAERVGIHVGGIRRHLGKLRDAGLLTWEQRGRKRSNVYVLDLGGERAPTRAHPTPPDDSERAPTRASSARRRAHTERASARAPQEPSVVEPPENPGSAETAPRTQVKDGIVALLGSRPASGSGEWGVIERITSAALDAADGDPGRAVEEVRVRWVRLVELWGPDKATLPTVLNRWAWLGSVVARAGPADVMERRVRAGVERAEQRAAR